MTTPAGTPLPRGKSLLPAVALGLIGLVVIAGIALDQLYFKNLPPKKRMAPEAVFYDRTGKEVSLESYRGKIVLLNFWATWCGPCIEEAPSLDQLSAQLKRELPDVVIIAPALDDQGFEAVDPFVEKLKLNDLFVVHDKKKAAFDFGTKKLPESWLVGRDGEILERFVGALNWAHPDIFKLLQKAAKEGPDAFRKERESVADRAKAGAKT